MDEDVIRKLRLTTEQNKLIINTPDQFLELMKTYSFDSKVSRKSAYYDFIMVFSDSQSELEEFILSTKGLGKYDYLFWACYPKDTSKNYKSDIKRDTIWHALNLIDIRAVTQIALDQDWSAMRGRPHATIGKWTDP